jgi:iron complex outermembrane receptor protein
MRFAAFLLTLTLGLVAPVTVRGQQPPDPAQPPLEDETLRLRLPVVTVTAEKTPVDVQRAPVSLSAVPKETLDNSVPRSVSDAADLAPNTWFNEFSARKLSNPRFRGIGSSPSNPGITTFIDGVPQLNANSSSIELADIEQIEFVRGPQSSLYGRNSVGGVVNITSIRPSMNEWAGSLTAPFGNFSATEVRGSISGPLASNLAGIGVTLGYNARDGYTRNDITGNDLDSRSAFFTKSQLLFTPESNWEARAIVTTERARDGDYALHDLAALRANPFHASRDYEGFTHRDIVAPTLIVRRTGETLDFSSTTGLVWWETTDSTDLDYTPFPAAVRDNAEKDRQFTQELRLMSSRDAAISLSSSVRLSWQTGLFLFTQAYEQEAVNRLAPFVLDPRINFAVAQHSPQSALDDYGVGGYGRGTFTFGESLEAIIGLRADYENKQGTLNTFYNPAIAPPVSVQVEDSFSDVSPQFTIAYHFPSRQMAYFTAARGFKAGGFNAVALPGSEAYGVEHSWNYEAGIKTFLAGQRLMMNADVFFMQWDDLQVNLPLPFALGQFYIANAGKATSKGIEAELTARLFEGCDFFAGVGYTNARFGDGSVSNGLPVGGNRIANAPNYTADFGGQYSVAITSGASAYARAEVVLRGDYYYDDSNLASQDAYTISNFRAGIRGRHLFGEAWARNAFDTKYIPVAFQYQTQSGYIGEMGAPRTFGVRVGVTF